MGFARFKEHFKIEQHIVSAENNVIYIGSDMASRLVGIDMQTGAVLVNDTFSSFLGKYYPEIFKATNRERLAPILEVDHFEQSIPVYTFCNDQLTEKFCEKLGFPNVTHDGEIMYNNSHFANKDDAIENFRRNLIIRIENYKDAIVELQEKLDKKTHALAEATKHLEQIEKAQQHSTSP